MGFLRRILGGGRPAVEGQRTGPAEGGRPHGPAGTGPGGGPAPSGGLAPSGGPTRPGGPAPSGGPATAPAATDLDEEAARDRELLRADAARLDDDLLQRQLRYADRSWTPPRQGSSRRADDAGEVPERGVTPGEQTADPDTDAR